MRYRKDGRLCIQCNKPLPSNRSKYCSYECEGASAKAKFLALNPTLFRGKTSSTTGAISELRVAVDLLSRGYDVFRALSPACSCDLAILKDDKLLRIEVRTACISSSGKMSRVINSHSDKGKFDHYAWVLPDKIVYEPPLP